MAGLFKSQKTELPAPKQITTPGQQQGYDYLQDYLKTAKPTPYTQELSAKPQSFESAIPGLVSRFTQRETSPLIETAQKQLQETIGGGYDPSTSPYYKAYKTSALENLEEAKTSARQSAQIGGMLRSSGRLKTENRLIRGTTQDVNSILGQMFESERQRQLSAVPQALSLSQYQEGAPIRSLEAIMAAGGYQGGQQQSELDRQYAEFQRIEQEKKAPLGVAETLASPGLYNYYQPTFDKTPSPWTQYIQPLIESGMMAAGAAAGGAKPKAGGKK